MPIMSHVIMWLIVMSDFQEGTDKGLDVTEYRYETFAPIAPFDTMLIPVQVGKTWYVMLLNAHHHAEVHHD